MRPTISAIERAEQLPPADWWSGFRFGMGERPDGVFFLEFPGDAARARECENGVAFGERREFRWRRRRGGWHLLLVDDDGATLPGAAERDCKALTPDLDARQEVLLWGEADREGRFWESRIPHELHYPVIGEGRRMRAVLRGYTMVECEPVWTDEGIKDRQRERRLTRMVRLRREEA